MGFAAVFGGAANTPIAATLMVIKFFGIKSGVFLAIDCVMSYLFLCHAGIYSSQDIGSEKYHFIPTNKGANWENSAQEIAPQSE
ncbi:hypothetical protein [Microcoleus sp. Pol12A5]|uniref:hypothetical protein n=1 Tax=Microcoleus sp. Pol12A5 TaxID=3055392 RepID=UPI002FCFC674